MLQKWHHTKMMTKDSAFPPSFLHRGFLKRTELRGRRRPGGPPSRKRGKKGERGKKKKEKNKRGKRSNSTGYRPKGEYYSLTHSFRRPSPKRPFFAQVLKCPPDTVSALVWLQIAPENYLDS
jgi:hypothetical protein